MALAADRRHANEVLERRNDVRPETLIDLLSDEYVRKFLGTIRAEAKSARAIAEECGASRPTVYRRLNRLRDAGLVAEQVEHDPDGHHRRTFRAVVEGMEVTLGTDGFEAEVTADERPSPALD